MWLGWLTDRQRELVLVVDDDTDIDWALSDCRKIGFDRRAETLPIATWQQAPNRSPRSHY